MVRVGTVGSCSTMNYQHKRELERRIKEQLLRAEPPRPSSYDTAWVAMVLARGSPRAPRFPPCVEWILQNQHGDGSWGLGGHLDAPSLGKDALSSTLACVLALRTWNVGDEHIRKGLRFIGNNSSCVTDDRCTDTPIGFNIIFPGMLGFAIHMGLELPLSQADVDVILRLRDMELKRVLDNLKDYAVRAVVNAVDHLGTVACKLTDLFEQQASEISTFELKVARLNQQIITSQIYTDKQGLRQQQMMGTNMKHHKHYVLPSTGYKRTQAYAHLQTHTNQESKPRPYPSAKTLSWHLASENSTAANRAQRSTLVLGDIISSKLASDGSNLFGKELPASPMRRPLQLNGNNRSDVTQKVGAKDQPDVKHMSTFNSFDKPRGREIQKAPVGTKNMLATLFIKHKSAKMKKISVR